MEERLIDLYVKVTQWAMEHNQVVGEKNDYYITLAQLEYFIKELQK